MIYSLASKIYAFSECCKDSLNLCIVCAIERSVNGGIDRSDFLSMGFITCHDIISLKLFVAFFHNFGLS